MDVLLISNLASLRPKSEGFEAPSPVGAPAPAASPTTAERVLRFLWNSLWFLISCYSAYLSWSCTTVMGHSWFFKVIMAAFAFTFGFIYLIFYLIFRMEPCAKIAAANRGA